MYQGKCTVLLIVGLADTSWALPNLNVVAWAEQIRLIRNHHPCQCSRHTLLLSTTHLIANQVIFKLSSLQRGVYFE